MFHYLLHLFGYGPVQPKEPARERKAKHHNPPLCSNQRSSRVESSKRPTPTALSPKESVQSKYLAQTKCFALVDDTPSMQTSWSQTRAVLAGVVGKLSSDRSWDGLNIRFLHHVEPGHSIKTVGEFERIFDSVSLWRGEKAMAERVSQVFGESIRLFHETCTPRPVVLLIVTDGIAVDTQALQGAILGFSRDLSEKNVPAHMFRIYLLQMGDDREAVGPLHDFRDRIAQRDLDRRILNVVSFHRGRGLLDAQYVFNLLVGSTNIPVEEDGEIRKKKSPVSDLPNLMGPWSDPILCFG